MRAFRVLSSVVVGCCAATVLAATPAAATGGFTGSWAATDFDGSHLTLSVRGGSGGHYAVHEVDDRASVCGGAPANVVGAGAANGNVLTASVTLACRPGGNILRHRIDISFTVHANGTLTDNEGIVWRRA